MVFWAKTKTHQKKHILLNVHSNRETVTKTTRVFWKTTCKWFEQWNIVAEMQEKHWTECADHTNVHTMPICSICPYTNGPWLQRFCLRCRPGDPSGRAGGAKREGPDESERGGRGNPMDVS